MSRETKYERFCRLLLNQTNYVSISYFMHELNISEKTVYNHLEKLEYELKSYQLQLLRKKGCGIMIENDFDKKKAFLKHVLNINCNSAVDTNNRRQLIYEELLLSDGTISINSLSDKYIVSSSSIVNDLKEIEIGLKEYNLRLCKNVKGTQIEGNETDLRRAKCDCIFEQLKKTLILNKQINKQNIRTILNEYFDVDFSIVEYTIDYIQYQLLFDLNTIYYMQFYVFIAVFIDRIKNNHYILDVPNVPVATELHILKTYPVAVEMCKLLEIDINKNISLSEIQWINACIGSVYHENNYVTSDSVPKNVKKLVNEVVSSLSEIFNNRLSQDQLLIAGLEKHFVPMLIRLMNDVKISNPFLNQIKKQYSALFSIVSLSSSCIENFSGKQLSEDEISFLLIHFQAAIERLNLSKNIAIIVQEYDAYASLIESNIRKNMPVFNAVEIIEKKNIKSEYLNQFDFAILTVEYEEQINIPFVSVGSVITDEEILRIKVAYDKGINHQIAHKYPNISKVIDKDCIWVKEHCSNKKEIIEKIGNYLLAKDYVISGFVDSVMQREIIAPTNLIGGIAIPHGSDKFVKENKIFVVTLDNKIEWGNGEVDLILLVAVNFSQKTTSEKLLGELYYFISNEEQVLQIKNCAYSNDVISFFKQS